MNECRGSKLTVWVSEGKPGSMYNCFREADMVNMKKKQFTIRYSRVNQNLAKY